MANGKYIQSTNNNSIKKKNPEKAKISVRKKRTDNKNNLISVIIK